MIDNVQRQLEDSLFMERTFNATPERIFAAWTTPKQLKKWWGPPGSVVIEAQVDLCLGGQYRLGIKQQGHGTYFVTGHYHTIERPHKLAFTWRWENPEMDIGDSLVTIELRAKGEKTELHLTHAQLPSKEARASHEEGWVGILGKLGEFLIH